MAKKRGPLLKNLIIAAILILIVIIVVFKILTSGTFSTDQLGDSCVAAPGYLCQAPLMNASASGPLLGIQATQNTGTSVYNVEFACVEEHNLTGKPNVSENAKIWGYSNFPTLANGQTVDISLVCFNSNGTTVTNSAGQWFSGTIFMNYTKSNESISDTNPRIINTFAIVNVQAH